MTVHVGVEKEGSQDLSSASFQTVKPALLDVTTSKDETLVLDKLHDYSDHVLIQQKSQQLADKATIPESVICLLSDQ